MREDSAGSSIKGRPAMPPSIDPGIPTLPSTPPPGWTRINVRGLFEVIERPVKLEPEQAYELVVARRNRGGIESRGKLKGKAIKVPQQFLVQADDFLLSNRQISHGGCGIVPAELSGAIVSGEYTVLRPTSVLLLDYLRHLTHARYFQQICFHSSVGVHVEKLVFRPDVWMAWEIDLPGLDEQRMIAAVLQECDNAIAATDALVAAKREARKGLMQRLLAHVPNRVELTNFARLRKVAVNEAGDSIELENIEAGTGQLLGTTRIGESRRFRFEPGDTLFGRLRPYLDKRILAKVAGLCSTEIWVLAADTRKCLSPFLYLLTQTAEFKAAASIQSGSKMPRAEWDVVSAAPLPLPSLDEQDRIVTILGGADREIELLADQAAARRRQKRGLMQKLLTGHWRMAQAALGQTAE